MNRRSGWECSVFLWVFVYIHSFFFPSLSLSLQSFLLPCLPFICLSIYSSSLSGLHSSNIIHSSIHPSIYLISFTNGFHVMKIITCLYKLNSIQRYLHKSKINHHLSYPPNSSPPPTPKVSPFPTP